ncbi:MAG: mexE [Chthoniobacteraceae bacterium]|nr:mexE [Chthoniobacteraceae bacterium]
MKRIELHLFFLLLLAGCHRKVPSAVPPPPKVTVAPVVEKEIIEWNEYIGRTDAVESVEIRARVSGYLTSVDFKPGSLVKKGDLLFTIDARPYKADLARAEGQLEQARARQKLAEADFERVKELRNRNVVAANEFDNKSSALLHGKGGTVVAEAELETARLNVEFCFIRSPIDGRVSRENVSVGNLVQPNTAQGGILTTVVAVDPLYAYIDVDESAILNYIKLSKEGRLKTARESRVALFMGLQNEEGFPHEGYVDFVDNRITPGTGTMRVRGQWKNWDALLTPGFFVHVRVAASPKYPALLVPDYAIGVDQGERFVLVVGADKKVRYRTVKLGTLADGMRVVYEGLKPGELIVVNGLMRAQPGSEVDAEMAAPAQPIAAAANNPARK